MARRAKFKIGKTGINLDKLVPLNHAVDRSVRCPRCNYRILVYGRVGEKVKAFNCPNCRRAMDVTIPEVSAI